MFKVSVIDLNFLYSVNYMQILGVLEMHFLVSLFLSVRLFASNRVESLGPVWIKRTQ